MIGQLLGKYVKSQMRQNTAMKHSYDRKAYTLLSEQWKQPQTGKVLSNWKFPTCSLLPCRLWDVKGSMKQVTNELISHLIVLS